MTLDSAPPAMQQHILSDAGPRGPVGQPARRSSSTTWRPNLRQGRDAQRQGAPGARPRHQPRGLRHGARRRERGQPGVHPASARPCPDTATPTRSASGPSGDAARARAALQESGLTLPVKVRVAYRSTPTSDKALAALVNGWEEAGFAVQLQPIAEGLLRRRSPARPRRPDRRLLGQLGARVALGLHGHPAAVRQPDQRHQERQRPRLRRLLRRGGQPGDHPDRGPARPGGQATAWAALDASLAERGPSSPSRSARRSTSRAAR